MALVVIFCLSLAIDTGYTTQLPFTLLHALWVSH